MRVDTWMPCIGDAGLQIFTETADQRAALGETHFLQTHFPIQMRRTRNGRTVDTVSEQALLSELVECRHVRPGNRVMLLANG